MLSKGSACGLAHHLGMGINMNAPIDITPDRENVNYSTANKIRWKVSEQ